MDAEQKRFLEKKFHAAQWRRRRRPGRRLVQDIDVEGWELAGWAPQRIRRDEYAKVLAVRSLWSRGDPMKELLAVDVFRCPSEQAADDQLIEVLGNIESDAVEWRSDKDVPGEVAFSLDDTIVLFGRANVVVLVRNAGPSVVSVWGVARQVDRTLMRGLEPKGTDKNVTSRRR